MNRPGIRPGECIGGHRGDVPAAACGADRRSASSRDVVAAVGSAAAAAVLFLLAHRALIDDAYITLSYARNVAYQLHWGVIEQETANTATSPLAVGLLAAVTALVREPVVAVGVVLMATLAATGVWAGRTARLLGLSRLLPVLTVGLLVVNPLLVSTIGLETYLGAALVVGLGYYSAAGRASAAGVVSGLLVLTRPDLVVFAAVAALAVAALRRRLFTVAGIAAAVALPWHVVSWFALGSALPDTFLLKTGSSKWYGSYDFANGWQLYGQVYPVATVLAALPAALGVLCLAAWAVPALRRGISAFCLQNVSVKASFSAFCIQNAVIGPRLSPGTAALPVVFGIGGLAHLAVFAALGTAPYHWYYGPAVAALSCCAAATVAALVHRRGVMALAAAPLAVLAAISAGLGMVRDVPWTVTPITTNWALPDQYARIGTDLAATVAGSTVTSPGEIGTLAYFCDCAIVDAFSDRGVMVEVIRQNERQAGPLLRAVLELNYRHLDAGPPRAADHVLRYERDRHAAGPLQWDVTSPWFGPGRVVLVAPSSG